MISYKVTQTTPTFKIEEAAVGSGAKCGATFVEEVRILSIQILFSDVDKLIGIPEMVTEVGRACCFWEDSEREDSPWQSDDQRF